ncbi:hypothetical protein ACGFK1_09795 [Mycobacterium sp. NPDC048908]|uniref:hypothetical protein n=1 Tax=Mycobacterium sp. NPDC048908 TaxID=3364292 RepID=UPI003717FA2B
MPPSRCWAYDSACGATQLVIARADASDTPVRTARDHASAQLPIPSTGAPKFHSCNGVRTVASAISPVRLCSCAAPPPGASEPLFSAAWATVKPRLRPWLSSPSSLYSSVSGSCVSASPTIPIAKLLNMIPQPRPRCRCHRMCAAGCGCGARRRRSISTALFSVLVLLKPSRMPVSLPSRLETRGTKRDHLLAPGELVHVDADLTISRRLAFPDAPKHQLRHADLTAQAAASQHGSVA